MKVKSLFFFLSFLFSIAYGQDMLKLAEEEYVNDYTMWVATYSGKERINKIDWSFHQFTENVCVKGINTSVDGNNFKGSFDELRNYYID